jgi:glycosyltransferase involved in cell wall biosynthesis
MFFSIIVPVYNRPQEIRELLESLTRQSFTNFEVVIVEDGSLEKCKAIVESFNEFLNITYFYIPNGGQGFARNYGMEKASGDYFVLFDSDCIIPPEYLSVLAPVLEERSLDAHGGPDAAQDNFSNLQQAINYSMTSALTTGGIRGKTKDRSNYQARGYNMGLSRKAFKTTGGFVDPNKGEDIELSIRIKKSDLKLELVEEAFVYHKRRNTLFSFFKQSFSFGQNRVNVSRYHSNAIKTVHLLPSFFLLYTLFVLIYASFGKPYGQVFFGSLISWSVLILLHAAWTTRSLPVALLSVITSFGQLSAYGLGLISEYIKEKFSPTLQRVK